jgi:hypothetical protein
VTVCVRMIGCSSCAVHRPIGVTLTRPSYSRSESRARRFTSLRSVIHASRSIAASVRSQWYHEWTRRQRPPTQDHDTARVDHALNHIDTVGALLLLVLQNCTQLKRSENNQLGSSHNSAHVHKSLRGRSSFGLPEHAREWGEIHTCANLVWREERRGTGRS